MRKILGVTNRLLFNIIFIVLFVFLIFLLFTAITNQILSFFISFLGIVVFVWIIKNYKNYIFNSRKNRLIFIIVISIAIKSIVCLLYHPTLEADYNVFHSFATLYSKSYFNGINTLYIALFNHVFGYSFILSILYIIFGSHVIVAVGFNIFLSAISSVLIFLIGEKCFGEKTGIIASILWVLCPSQSLWNLFVLSEPLYTCILLAVIYLVISNDFIDSKRNIILGVGIGVLLATFNMIRPLGIIVLFAIFLWLFMILKGGKRTVKILFFVFILIAYLISKIGITYIIEDRNNIKCGGFSWYNINVGLNYESYGSWNEADWNRILEKVNKYSEENVINPAKKAQDDEKNIVVSKLSSIKNPILFMYKKVYTFAGHDSGVVDHLRDCNAFTSKWQKIGLSLISNSFYYMLIITSLIGIVIYYKNRNCDQSRKIVLPILYGLGLMCVHIVAEVQPRYHYSFIIVLIFLSSYFFTKIKSIKLIYNYSKINRDKNRKMG